MSNINAPFLLEKGNKKTCSKGYKKMSCEMPPLEKKLYTPLVPQLRRREYRGKEAGEGGIEGKIGRGLWELLQRL